MEWQKPSLGCFEVLFQHLYVCQIGIWTVVYVIHLGCISDFATLPVHTVLNFGGWGYFQISFSLNLGELVFFCILWDICDYQINLQDALSSIFSFRKLQNSCQWNTTYVPVWCNCCVSFLQPSQILITADKLFPSSHSLSNFFCFCCRKLRSKGRRPSSSRSQCLSWKVSRGSKYV